MAARPDPQREHPASPSARPELAPGAVLNLSDARPRPSAARKRHSAPQGGAPVVSILHAPSIRDQLAIPPADRRNARPLLGGLADICRRADITPAALLRFESGGHLDPDEFARLDRLVRDALALRKFGA